MLRVLNTIQSKTLHMVYILALYIFKTVNKIKNPP